MIGRGSGGQRSGDRGWLVAGGLTAILLVAGCSSGGTTAESPEDNEVAADSTTTTTSASTTTTVEATSSTLTTLSELAQAEAEIEAAIVGWWTFPRDSSLGDEGIPVEYLTDPILTRIRELAVTRTDAGQIQRSRGTSRIRADRIDIDLESGAAEIDVCSVGDHELVDAETGEILAADVEQGFTGVVFAERVGGEWKVRDFSTSQAGDSPKECDIDA